VPEKDNRILSAVFLDRDGVINENRDDYVKSIDELEFLPGAVDAAGRLSAAGIRIVIVSNQQGVGRGIISPKSLEQVNAAVLRKLVESDVKVSGVYYCPHLKEDDCECRKPKPGLLIKAAADLEIDLNRSVFVGDAPSDVQAGRAAGCATVLVLSGKTSAEDVHRLPVAPDHVAADLSEAVRWILQSYNPSS
jgi:D-glycero-D-manno-heptose 1,7-bisphosphate phosphatase